MSLTSVIREAVTAVMQHGDDIFMIRRARALASFPGYWAFPGGKVDVEDDSAAARSHVHFAGIEPRAVEALARELREEVGFDIDEAAKHGHILAFHPIGTALTPPTVPVRFDTLFYRLLLRDRPVLTLDAGEVEAAEWRSAREWMELYRKGRLLLAPPTRAALELYEAGGGTQPGSLDFEAHHERSMPVLEAIRGVRQIHVRSNTLPPAAHTNCFVLGDDEGERLLVDPAPKDRDFLEALYARVASMGIGEVFLTHHHPDHRQFANELARRLGVPIGMSADTEERIRRLDPGFLDGLTVRTHFDGEVVAKWLGQPLRVVAVPGHDEGHLALMPDDRAWCIVGDLIQGIGTVVIAKPEGHMGRYFASMQKLIDEDPAVIFPSHGIGMGSTHRLSETLKHRRMREEAVLARHAQGESIDQMLEAMYKDVDPRLLPLARMNIEQHLEKLRDEGRVA